MAEAAGAAPQLTEHEQAVYDRQLRVWGVETQKRRAQHNDCSTIGACHLWDLPLPLPLPLPPLVCHAPLLLTRPTRLPQLPVARTAG